MRYVFIIVSIVVVAMVGWFLVVGNTASPISIIQTDTPTVTATNTPAPTFTATVTPVPTNTPTPTVSPTATSLSPVLGTLFSQLATDIINHKISCESLTWEKTGFNVPKGGAAVFGDHIVSIGRGTAYCDFYVVLSAKGTGIGWLIYKDSKTGLVIQPVTYDASFEQLVGGGIGWDTTPTARP